MKSKELIKLLQDLDPAGETEVCVDNLAIFSVYSSPSYWDGPLNIILREDAADKYKITGFKITGRGTKIVIKALLLEDIFLDYPDLPVCLDELSESRQKELSVSIEKKRTEMKKIVQEADEWYNNGCKEPLIKPEDFNES